MGRIFDQSLQKQGSGLSERGLSESGLYDAVCLDPLCLDAVSPAVVCLEVYCLSACGQNLSKKFWTKSAPEENFFANMYMLLQILHQISPRLVSRSSGSNAAKNLSKNTRIQTPPQLNTAYRQTGSIRADSIQTQSIHKNRIQTDSPTNTQPLKPLKQGRELQTIGSECGPDLNPNMATRAARYRLRSPKKAQDHPRPTEDRRSLTHRTDRQQTDRHRTA